MPFSTGSSGGSLGGTGGRTADQAIPAHPRGSVFYPWDFGSCGGSGHSGSVGLGGGIIALNAPVVDIGGGLTADGTSSTGNRNGGGSGGSILIQGTIFNLVSLAHIPRLKSEPTVCGPN